MISLYGLKLPVGYYSSPTKLAEKNNRNMSRQCINVTFDVVIGKFTIGLLEGVNVQFHREFSCMTGFIRNIAFSQRSRGVCDMQRGVYSMYVFDVAKDCHKLRKGRPEVRDQCQFTVDRKRHRDIFS